MDEPATGTEMIARRGLWHLGGRSFWQIGFEAFREYRRNRLGGQCAQFAYYSLLALAPMLILIVASVSHLPVTGVLESFHEAVDRGMPDQVAKLLERQVRDIRERSSWEVVLGSLFVLGFAGSRMIWCVGKGLDAAFDVQIKRHAWIRGSTALGLTAGLFFLLIAGMLVLVIGPMLTELTPLADFQQSQAILYFLIRWGTAAGLMLIAVAVIYWLLPNADVPWCWLSPGSVFATLGWISVTLGFRFYVANLSRYNETYGALTGVVVLLTWLYLTGTVLLMGGQINAIIFRGNQPATRETAPAQQDGNSDQNS